MNKYSRSRHGTRLDHFKLGHERLAYKKSFGESTTQLTKRIDRTPTSIEDHDEFDDYEMRNSIGRSSYHERVNTMGDGI